MGFFSNMAGLVVSAVSSVGDFLSGGSSSGSYSSSHSSNTQTIYEPDKVRVAELENQKAEILIDGQKDIIEMNARMQAAIIEAEARGFEYKAKVLKSLVQDMNIMAQQRLKLLEEGHFEVVKQIEGLYLGFQQEIDSDKHIFISERMPQLLNILAQYEKGSDGHEMYRDLINQHALSGLDSFNNKTKGFMQRQHQLIESSITCKEKTLEKALQLDTHGMQLLEQQIEHKGTSHLNAPETQKSLPSANTQQLPDNL
jgi:hypothetical protein